MTKNQRQRLIYLLQGCYFRETRNDDGVLVYKIYEGNGIPVTYFPVTDFHAIPPLPSLFGTPPAPVEPDPDSRFFKKDRKGRVTLNFSIVRQQHGNTWIKRRYKKIKNEKNDHQPGTPESSTEEAVAGGTGKACRPCYFQFALSGKR